jgi:Cytochrome P450
MHGTAELAVDRAERLADSWNDGEPVELVRALPGDASLVAALDRLARHPELEARWHSELDEVLGERPVRPDDLEALPFTRGLLAEPLLALVLVTLGQRWAFRAVAGRPARRRIWLRPVRRR